MVSFASALVACIGVIAAGYGAGRIKIIDTAGAGPAAIGAFVGRFALPALLFRELATLRWKDIDGRLLASVAAAKALLFAGVLGCSTLLESRRAGDDDKLNFATCKRLTADRDFKRLVARARAHLLHAVQRLRAGAAGDPGLATAATRAGAWWPCSTCSRRYRSCC